MQFKQHYSGSSGNLYEAIAENGQRFIIDPGMPWKKVQAALNYDLSGIVGCLVSHSHNDHCHSAQEVMQAGIDLYATAETLNALGIADNRKAHEITDQTLITFAGIQALSFKTNHDCPGSVGFVVRDQLAHEFLLFATDTSHITQRFKFPFSIIAIECSYDKDILQSRVDTGDINETLAKRLLTSHMEWRNALKYIHEFCDLSKCKEIHLLHMSSDNIEKEDVRSYIEKRTFVETITVNGQKELKV